MKLNLDSLNENQRAAVEWTGGPLLVLAGPGSGKTQVLTLRVAKLLLDSPEKRFRVLGLTFTNKAAAEMRERVDVLVKGANERSLLTTFHSFSAEVLRQHGSHIGLRPDFTILNQEADREGILHDAILDLQRSSDEFSDEDINLLPMIDRLLAECIPTEGVVTRFNDAALGTRVQTLYSKYRELLVSGNRLDFPSLILEAHRLLLERPGIAKQLRTMYSHVCVDEFQDTNLAQYQVLTALLGQSFKHLFVVADDDQIIYQWNGANPERLKALQTDFNMEVIQLPANYRCPPEVISIANKLIIHNLDRAEGKKPLYAVRPSSGRDRVVRVEVLADQSEEAEWIAQDIKTHHSTETGKCAVLARTKKLLEVIAERLEAHGLEASLAVRKSEFDARGPIGWLHIMLRLALARGDREQLRRACKSFYELEGVDIRVADVIAQASANGGDLLRSWFTYARGREGVDSETLEFLEKAERELLDRGAFLKFCTLAFKWFDVKEQQLGPTGGEGFADYKNEKSAWEDIQKDIAHKYSSEDLTLHVFLQELDLREKSPPIPPNAVRCLTIHSAKGLEWEHVYIAGLAEDQLPSFQSIKKGPGSREMQEERRNCFVAITRAQTRLVLTRAKTYFGWSKEPSRFLQEMGLDGAIK
jgi:DNA helicase II / ATP-dependent DNA helicase PcrA